MEKLDLKEIELNGVIYMPKDLANKDSKSNFAEQLDNMSYVLVRSYGAGVFIGYLKEEKDLQAGKEVLLVNSRNIYYWDGAAGVSQIAEEGVSKPENCKITIEVKLRKISNVIEILYVTEKAKENLNNIKAWKK
jgi:hypothetical protein